MSAVFTERAIERMRRHDVTAVDVSDLLEKVERVAQRPGDLAGARDAVRLGGERGGATYIVRAGEMRAIMAIDPDQPERIIVLGIYRADEAGHDPHGHGATGEG